MSRLSHKIYVLTLIIIVVVVFGALAILGFDYYLTDKEQQFFHEQNDLFKPSGTIGHGVGFIGFFLIIAGFVIYIARKRFGFLSHLGDLKSWLEFHIFLCSLGAVLVLFHSAFKFAGYSAYAFFAMILVLISGAIGLFFFYQVPRNREGRKMSLEELKSQRAIFDSNFQKQFQLDNEFIEFLNSTLKTEVVHFEGTYFSILVNHFQYEKQLLFSIKNELALRNVSKADFKNIIKTIEADVILNRRVLLFTKMRTYYKLWSVVHWVFTVIMMIVVIVHVVISMLFGYRWIF